MGQEFKLSASLEDYIEAIYNIVAEKQVARGKDIAASLSVSGASVTAALRSLAKKGLVNYVPYEAISLTDTGRRAAEDVVRRHNALKRFFISVLAVDKDLAEQGACRVEHAAPQEIIDRIISFRQFLELRPNDGEKLIQDFADFCKQSRPGSTGQ